MLYLGEHLLSFDGIEYKVTAYDDEMIEDVLYVDPETAEWVNITELAENLYVPTGSFPNIKLAKLIDVLTTEMIQEIEEEKLNTF